MAKKTTAADLLSRYQQDATALMLTAEVQARKYQDQAARDGGYGIVIEPADAFLMRSAGFTIDDPLAFRQQLNRAIVEQELAPQAGTRADRAEAQQAAERAKADLSEKAPALREQIAALQRDLAGLEAAEQQASATVAAMATAHRELCNRLPMFVESAAKALQRQLTLAGMPKEVAHAEANKLREEYAELAATGPRWVEALAADPSKDPAAAAAHSLAAAVA